MKLHYYKAAHGNFGDDINAWLWRELRPELLDDDPSTLFLGIGTILSQNIPPAERYVVFSSGLGYGAPPRGANSPLWDIRAVRGPLTAEVLGLPPEKAVGDGALLLSRLQRFSPKPKEDRRGVVFVPHFESLMQGGWDEAATLADVTLIDPRWNSEDVIQRLRGARLVLAESMHAAIIADALRVPWVPVFSSRSINMFKFLDWSLGMGVPYEPRPVPAPSPLVSYGDRVSRFYNDSAFLRTPDKAHALAHFRNYMDLERRPWWPTAQRWIRRGFRTVPDRIIRARYRPGSPRMRRRIENTASALRALKANPGFLSEDRVLQEKSGRLLDQLFAIPKTF